MIRFCSLVFAIAALVPLGASATPAERSSSAADRQAVNLTVYNGGVALIHDRRRVTLRAGLNRIAWQDVSASIEAPSALLDAIGGGSRVSVLEQNFDFDLYDPTALLQKYVGKEVIVVHDPRFAGELETRESARILSATGGVVLQYRDRIENGVRGHIIFPTSAQGFRDRPTLVLDVQSARAGAQTLDLSYLTSGLSWSADYVGVVSADEKHLSLTGLVTLSNTSGIAYENARLQLLAGNVNVAPPQAAAMRGIASGVGGDIYSAPMRQDNYFEYHLYTLARPTSILDKQTKQVSLLNAREVPIQKTLELRGSNYYYQTASPELGTRLPVAVYLSFQNRGADLGIPLPAGTVRLYQNDFANLSQFLGSDSIDHTPRNETVRLHLGDSFDVTARKRQTDFQLITNCTSEGTYEIDIANAKTTAQSVLVVEPIPGMWKIVNESAPHVKSSSSSANWTLNVPADGHTALTYTTRVSWCRN